jgi:hypothetical protein
MGCWDAFCPLCGISLNKIDINNFITYKNKQYDSIYNVKTKKYDKKPKKESDIILKKDNLFVKEKVLSKTKWLNNCTILLPNEKAKHNFKEIYCNINFSNLKTKESYNINNENNDFDTLGIVIHTNCWKLAKNNYDINLKFDDFNMKKIVKNQNMWSHYKFKYLNYKETQKYESQMFNIDLLHENPEDFYLLYSPLDKNVKSIKNMKRINKNIENIIKNIPPKRPSPTQSATLFSLKTIMKGNDGYNYIVKNDKNKTKKWIKL